MLAHTDYNKIKLHISKGIHVYVANTFGYIKMM